jgi:hypothetical protein
MGFATIKPGEQSTSNVHYYTTALDARQQMNRAERRKQAKADRRKKKAKR